MPRPNRLPRGGIGPRRKGWVAVSGEGPVGQGLTANDARDAAKLSRSKELTQVTFIPEDAEFELGLPPIYQRVCGLLPDPSHTWLVGGSVRDALLRRSVNDLDFATVADGLTTARTVANQLNGAFYPLDAERGT